MELEAKIRIIEYPNGKVRRVLMVRQFLQQWQELCDLNSLPVEMVWEKNEDAQNTDIS